MRLLKDWRRRRLLARHGVRVEVALPVHRAGARSGVWPVLADRLTAAAVVYSFGVGDNAAWELELCERFGLTVHAFDPTPVSRAWVAARPWPAEFRFHPVGLGPHDGELGFAPPRKPGGVNHRPVAGGGALRLPVRRLPTLMAELGHVHLDVLKVDIEGGEYAVLDDLIAAAPVQLLLEFHHGQDGVPFARTKAAIAALRAAGYRVFDISERGLEFGFVRGG